MDVRDGARRPFVTWKLATTLDGRSAAADGTSRWITSRAAAVDSHRLRAQCDVMLVGTGTVEVDDPELTVRDEYDELLPHQPMRAVMGLRGLARGRRVFNDLAETVRLETRDPAQALAVLHERDRQHVFLEGGPQLAAAFLRDGLVDEVVAYVAPEAARSREPVRSATSASAVAIAEAVPDVPPRLDVTQLGDHLRLTARTDPRRP